MIQHYIEFNLPGVFLSETDSRKVDTRIPAKLTRIPKNAFALHYFDREELTVDGEKLMGKEKNFSPRIVFGEVFTLEHLSSLKPRSKYDILIGNIEQYETKSAVYCITENWQPLLKTDIVLSSHKDIKTVKGEV